LIHLSGFIAAPTFECKEFLHEFNCLDFPNIIPVMASFVLLEWRTDNQKPVNRHPAIGVLGIICGMG
jgi:hypothetical protein